MIYYAQYIDSTELPPDLHPDLEEMDEVEAANPRDAAAALVRDCLSSGDDPRNGTEHVLVGAKDGGHNWQIIRVTWCTQYRCTVVAPPRQVEKAA